MTRQNGSMQPFYIQAIETGYWDTRYDPQTDYDTVFADMKQIGANTAYVMLHWEDIEPADNTFDFTFADQVVNAAERQNMKLQWILFCMHKTEFPPCNAKQHGHSISMTEIPAIIQCNGLHKKEKYIKISKL